MACATIVVYKLWHLRHAPDGITTLAPSSCDPSVAEYCDVQLPQGGQLRLSMQPRPLRALQEFAVDVELSGASAERVELDLDGVDMSMGHNRSLLQGTGSRFAGRANLAICTTDSMSWQATVTVHGLRGTPASVSIPFRFEVGTHAPK